MRVGNQAQVFVDAIPDREFHGRIARIAPVLDAATRTACVAIDIPNPEGLLKAEMFVRVQLDLGTTRQATLIPREGLVYRGQQPGVYIIEGNTPTFRAIETGLTREDQVEVLANLMAGTKIAGRGASMIQEGDRVSTQQPQTPAKTAESPAPAEKPASDGGGRPQTVNRQASASPQTASYSSPGQ
jgi:multidrug efflux pump subunit AcrA (membrane-fusion protein)